MPRRWQLRRVLTVDGLTKLYGESGLHDQVQLGLEVSDQSFLESLQ